MSERQKRRLLVVDDPAPEEGERAVFKADVNPALKGSGELDLECGSCGAVLAESIWPYVVYDIGLICADCGAFNDTPSAIGGMALGAALYVPVGTYRFPASLSVRKDVPIIGEAFPGAGPPAAGSLVELPH